VNGRIGRDRNDLAGALRAAPKPLIHLIG
jgi:hypothetical protein